MQISELYGLFKQTSGISTDSRNIVPGSIFFALKGPHFNGNAFARQALADGAAFAVIIGEDEVRNGQATLKPLRDAQGGELHGAVQERLALDALPNRLLEAFGLETLT